MASWRIPNLVHQPQSTPVFRRILNWSNLKHLFSRSVTFSYCLDLPIVHTDIIC